MGLHCDPFPMTADPAAYVPRPATEQVLADVARHVLASPAPVALTGPIGLGKTLVLRVLAVRLGGGGAQAVYLPYPALPPEGLCAWALRELGEPIAANTEVALVAHARRRAAGGKGLLALLVDEGSGLPLETARRIVHLCARSNGALRLVVAASDGLTSGSVLAALGPSAKEVRLRTPMSATEMAVYVERRLELAGVAPALRARFGPRALARLQVASGGVPRRLHKHAAWLLRSEHRGDAAEEAELELSPHGADETLEV
jgi:type II secretory pathway predicted ATPase ExeA